MRYMNNTSHAQRREAVINFIDECVRIGPYETLTALAKGAKLAPSTLNRFRNNPDVKHIPSTRTLYAIAEAVGLELPLNKLNRVL